MIQDNQIPDNVDIEYQICPSCECETLDVSAGITDCVNCPFSSISTVVEEQMMY